MVALEMEKSVFDPDVKLLIKKSSYNIWRALVLKQILVYIRNGAFVIFGFFMPLGLASEFACLILEAHVVVCCCFCATGRLLWLALSVGTTTGKVVENSQKTKRKQTRVVVLTLID